MARAAGLEGFPGSIGFDGINRAILHGSGGVVDGAAASGIMTGSMIAVSDLSKNFGPQTLFEGVSIQFNPGNCYGLVGANGSGKSTFLKILGGEEMPSGGTVAMPKRLKLGVLKQDHFRYEDMPILEVAMMGNHEVWEAMMEKERLLEEKQALGFYLSGHPFTSYAQEVAPLARTRLAQIVAQSQNVTVAGVVNGLRVQQSRRGRMASPAPAPAIRGRRSFPPRQICARPRRC